jgi:DNA recombination protein RmuC
MFDQLIGILIAVSFGIIFGALVVWNTMKARIAEAYERGKNEITVALATAKERILALDEHAAQLQEEYDVLKQKTEEWRKVLDHSRDERAQLAERVLRLPMLESRIVSLLEQDKQNQQEILRLTRSEAEKTQQLQSVSERLAEVEQARMDVDRSLAEFRQQTADLREDAGRINAELRAARDAHAKLFSDWQTEKALREGAEERIGALSADLTELGLRFESDRRSIEEKHQQDLLRLTTSEAEKNQALHTTQARLVEMEAIRVEMENTITDLRQRIADLREESGRINAELIAERHQAEEKLSVLQEAKESLANQFKTLANDILEEKSKRFTEQNQLNLGHLLEPLREKINDFQGKVEEVYIKEGKERVALAEQVRQLMDLNNVLSQDAKNLTRALTGSSKTQGNWGELVLERVLETSGLRKGEEYIVQESYSREDGSRGQPDVVLNLPENRHLVIDAKVSLTAYEHYVSHDDEHIRQKALKAHLDSVRAHIKGLSAKNYPNLYGLKSLDFVLLFMPIEPAFMLAVTHDRELFMDAWQKNVLLVSPSTLLFVVRTVAHLWRQEAQSRNAQQIAQRGADLYDKLVSFVTDLETVGSRLKQAQNAYDDAHKKLTSGKGNAIRQAHLLRELGVKPTKVLPNTVLELSECLD